VKTQEVCFAKEDDIPEVDALLCSAQKPIGLSPTFCSSEKRLRRLEWLREKLAHDLLCVIFDPDGLAGAMVLDQDPFGRVEWIGYIVVAERMRGQGKIGPRLVRQAQSLAQAELGAEARNDHSLRLLRTCGFRETGKLSPSGHPLLVWTSTAT
jgi:hypothetical protein